jgi:hypothetical protein
MPLDVHALQIQRSASWLVSTHGSMPSYLSEADILLGAGKITKWGFHSAGYTIQCRVQMHASIKCHVSIKPDYVNWSERWVIGAAELML